MRTSQIILVRIDLLRFTLKLLFEELFSYNEEIPRVPSQKFSWEKKKKLMNATLSLGRKDKKITKKYICKVHILKSSPYPILYLNT